MFTENENLHNYNAEAAWLLSPYNALRFYIPGKGITVDEDGNIRFIPLGDISEFVYGQEIESDLLFDEYQLSADEKQNIKELLTVNESTKTKGIAVVYKRIENKKLFFFITTDNNPELFYKIPADEIEQITAGELAKAKAFSHLEPYGFLK